MAVTIGRFHTPAERHNLTTVSGDFELSLDLRAYDARHLATMEKRLGEIAAEVAQCGGRWRSSWASATPPRPARWIQGIIEELSAAAQRAGIAAPPLQQPRQPSDANNFVAAGVPVGMLRPQPERQP
ncbi:MAG: hypothetical protein QM722_01660 [Piscinibacter sp.]